MSGTTGSISQDRNIDRETVCWTTTAGGNEVFTGTIRHDDTLVGQPGTEFGWALFDQNQTPVQALEPGLMFVDCSTCCPEVIGRGCLEGGGEWVSIRNGDGTVDIVDVSTGETPPTADVLSECPRETYETTLTTVDASATETFLPGDDMVAWSVRSITGTVTLTVNNGDPQTMTVGEVISSSAQDYDGVLLDELLVATAAASSARLAILRRI